ncbi:hypothetical protein [Enterococcus faecium]|uniref:Uncharacterized protein n=1 Tax=Enterococcus faecium TaxID=1352 RepID=A0A242B1I9_ENTFC|nr:hypothetical protein [Enterococcus faecium]OTN86652.1 hypothetical protein A5810_002997 [Enterococcus faecium]OTN86728.1 hypothetical protein A5809_002827 [Enterococcus faecium]
MENNTQAMNETMENTSLSKKPRKRKKKTVSDIDLQIKELQKRKEELILKSKAEIGEFVLAILSKKDISLEDIENNKELFYEELETLLNENSQNFFELLK